MAELSNKTVSLLFGLAGGRCSICKTPVVDLDVKIGEMAHIIARNKGGARGELPFQGDINGYENLILLCPNDHKRVDNNPAAYPPEMLHQIKREHEYFVRQSTARSNQGRVMDVGGLHALMMYLPFTQIPTLMRGLPTAFDLRLLHVDDTCENFCKDFPHCRPFSDPHLERHFINFWQQVRNIHDYMRCLLYNDKCICYYDAPEIVHSNRSDEVYLSRNISADERLAVERQMQVHAEGISSTYYSFLQYLKSSYPEINLASFVGW